MKKGYTYQKRLHFLFGDARSDRCGILTTRSEKAIRYGRLRIKTTATTSIITATFCWQIKVALVIQSHKEISNFE
jgi:hypothetical protein